MTTRTNPPLKTAPPASFTPGQKPLLQRNVPLAAERRDTGDTAPPVVHEVLNTSGQPLDAPTRAGMENRFGADFSQVRVHAGEKAAESAEAVRARAYTVGQDVVFGAGQYAPGTGRGDRLLAHELTHTIQQGAVSSPPSSLQIGAPDTAHERAAEANEQGPPASAENTPAPLIQRDDEPKAPIESESDTDFNLRLDPDLIGLSLRVLRGEHSFGLETNLTDPVSIPLDLLGVDLGIDSSRLNTILSYDNRCNRAFQSALVGLQAGPFIGVNQIPWQINPRVGVRIGSLRFDPGVGLGFEGTDFSSVLFTLNLAAASTETPPECIAPPSPEVYKPPPEEKKPPGEKPPVKKQPPPQKKVEPPPTLPTYTINFFYDSTLLEPDSEDEFQRVFEFMQNVPDLHVHLTGHTSLEGTEKYNQGLSDRRAEAIRDRLVLGGIDANRIDTFGMGEFAPAVIEPSIPRRSLDPRVEEIRTINRRVEVVFYDPTGRFQPNFPTFQLTTPGPAPSSFSLGAPKLRLGQ